MRRDILEFEGQQLISAKFATFDSIPSSNVFESPNLMSASHFELPSAVFLMV